MPDKMINVNVGGELRRRYSQEEYEMDNELQIRKTCNGFIVTVLSAKGKEEKVGDSYVSTVKVQRGEHCFTTSVEMNKFITNYYKK